MMRRLLLVLLLGRMVWVESGLEGIVVVGALLCWHTPDEVRYGRCAAILGAHGMAVSEVDRRHVPARHVEDGLDRREAFNTGGGAWRWQLANARLYAHVGVLDMAEQQEDIIIVALPYALENLHGFWLRTCLHEG
jgi:hypothetical protein